MSDTTPPPTASKRAASPVSPETGTVLKRAREEAEDQVEAKNGNDGEKDRDDRNGIGEEKKMEDVIVEG